jgi:hyperosmotically inducible periplasmic protein
MTRNAGIKTSLIAISSLVLFGVAACDKPAATSSVGPAQAAGQKIDQAADKMKVESAKAGQVIDDTAITAAVKAGILAEPGLKVLKIDVDTKDGRVTLSGSADSADNVKKAEQIAANVNGVKGVDNRLAVSNKG